VDDQCATIDDLISRLESFEKQLVTYQQLHMLTTKLCECMHGQLVRLQFDFFDGRTSLRLSATTYISRSW
jgi:hypothetical protein